MAEPTAPGSSVARADALIRSGHPAEAASMLSAVLASGGMRPEARVALLLRSRAREDLHDLAGAIADLRSALAIEPRDSRARNGLGILLADSGDMAGALEEFRIATEIDPRYARAWSNFGNALSATGQAAAALAATRRSVEIEPSYAIGWSNLGAMSLDAGDEQGAREAYRRAVALKPDAQVMQVLANLERGCGSLDAAIALYQRAAAAVPGDAVARMQLGATLAELDDPDVAVSAFREARRRDPKLLRAAFGEALTLPMIYPDASAVTAARARYAEGLGRLESEIDSLVRGRSPADVIDDLRWTNFLLAYQGEDDRELQARFGGLVARAIDVVAPHWRIAPPRAANGRRLRVGFASAFFNDGTVGRYFRSWMTAIDRTRFDVHVYHLRRDLTPYLNSLSPEVARVRVFPGAALRPSTIAEAMRADTLDVIVYPELGMDVTSFALAALRLAPVQLAGWGHPVTTGHATIDAFVSCAAMEPDGADAHYTEALLRLPGIGTDYARPRVPEGASRAGFGLPQAVPLLLCPQSLFKIHPDNDALFGRVLAAVPAAVLVAFQGRDPRITAKFRARLAGVLAGQGIGIDSRIIFLPQCGHDDFLRINSVCDVMLDTLRWSGGNTSLDALAAGLPIVTLPGRFMRGRQSAAMLHAIGLAELVAGDEDDYVSIAVRLASDRDWRLSIVARLREQTARLFGDNVAVREFTDAVEGIARAR